MADLRIHFMFDYVDPGSYLTGILLHRWAQNRERTPSVSWTPLELRPPSSQRIDPVSPAWSALTDAMADIAAREGVPFIRPASVPWTRKAHELAFHAKEKGCFESVHTALFEAHFATGLDISRVDVLVEIAREHGLEPAETRTVLGVDRFVPAVEAARREALARSIRGVPTLEAGGGTLEGLTGGDELRSFLEAASTGSAEG